MTTLFSTDFESGTMDSIFPDNTPVNTAKYIIQSSVVKNGAKAFKFDASGGASDGPVKFFTVSTTVVYKKWWYYPSTLDGGSGNHQFRFCQRGGGNNQLYEFDPVVDGAGLWGFDILFHPDGTDSLGTYHRIVTFPTDTWFYFELLLTLNTPGVSNGVVKIGVNGSQVFSATNVLFRSGGSAMTGWDTFEAATNWETPHGGDIWYEDDIIITDNAADFLSGGGGGGVTATSGVTPRMMLTLP